MRTSLIEIQETEQYIQGNMDTGDRLVFEARMLTNPMLEANTRLQRQAYKLLLRLFHIKKVKQEITAVQQHVFTSQVHESFRQQIQSLFK
jgi:hypothetical protein